MRRLAPLLLRPKPLGKVFVVHPLRPDYGERRRKKEAAKIPLFAGLPGMLPTAEEIQERMEIGNLEWIRRHRQFAAEGWKKVRKWRETATDRQRELFADRWLSYPHSPEYALDLIHHIELGWVTVPIHGSR